MGRKIEIDVSDLLNLLTCYDEGGVMPHDVFNLIPDCCVDDIKECSKLHDDDCEWVCIELKSLFSVYVIDNINHIDICAKRC